jgi:hypothetical protein
MKIGQLIKSNYEKHTQAYTYTAVMLSRHLLGFPSSHFTTDVPTKF